MKDFIETFKYANHWVQLGYLAFCAAFLVSAFLILRCFMRKTRPGHSLILLVPLPFVIGGTVFAYQMSVVVAHIVERCGMVGPIDPSLVFFRSGEPAFLGGILSLTLYALMGVLLGYLKFLRRTP